jgi:hypothetical protein
VDQISRAQNNGVTAPKGGFQKGNQYRIKPGEVRNAGGRPKRKYFTKLFHELLADKEVREEIKQSMRKIVTSGRGMAPVLLAKEMSERLEGKVTQEVDMNVAATVILAEVIAERRRKRDDSFTIDQES